MAETSKRRRLRALEFVIGKMRTAWCYAAMLTLAILLVFLASTSFAVAESELRSCEFAESLCANFIFYVAKQKIIKKEVREASSCMKQAIASCSRDSFEYSAARAGPWRLAQ